jgi:cyclic-di-GMP-binding protein
MIKDSKLKVNAQIQDEQVRVTAPKIDDLQAVIKMVKEAELDFPTQFVNMK